jgi:Protein of unknown function (DUF1569)
MPVETSKVKGRRLLRFEALDDVLAEAERLVARPTRQLGNWTLGEVLMHLALVGHKSIDGTTNRPGWLFIKSADGKMTPPRWFVRVLARPFVPMARRWLRRRRGIPVGIRPPAFIWKEVAPITPKGRVTAEAALAELRRAISRLKTERGRDLDGIMTVELFNLYHLRHAEMHLSFIVPEGIETQPEKVVKSPGFDRLFVGVMNRINRIADSVYDLLHRPVRKPPPA